MDVPPAVPTAPVAARRPGPRRVAIAAAVVLAVTIVRPWDVAAPPPPGAAPPTLAAADVAHAGDPGATDARNLVVAATPPADPSPGPSLLPDEIGCNPGGWTVVSLDRLGPWTVRSWVPAQPVRADGPLDPRIGRLTLESPDVLAIGACTPSTTDASGASTTGAAARLLGAWHIDAGRATPVRLDTRRAEASPTVATLYRPSDALAPAAAPAHWPGGEYVLELERDPGPDPAGGWFLGVVVRGPS